MLLVSVRDEGHHQTLHLNVQVVKNRMFVNFIVHAIEGTKEEQTCQFV